MTVRHTAILALALAACSSGRSGGTGRGTGKDKDGGTSQPGNTNPDVDSDGDGYTPNQGDCNDSSAVIGPNSVEINGNGVDDDCDGKVDNATACDTGIVGQKTAAAMTAAIGLCATKFITGTKFVGPSVDDGRETFSAFGSVQKLEGSAMAFMSSGSAQPGPYNPQPGTDLSMSGVDTSYQSPYSAGLAVPPTNGCGNGPPDTVNDYTELEVDLTVPYNVNSFSFQFQFFSAEYPEFVCTTYNDRFLVIVDDGTGNLQQVAFDDSKNPISVNNGFFTICQNDSSKPQTQHCTKDVSAISGTGYEQMDFSSTPVGGSTGWLTTTVPVTPGDKIKLRFLVYDEGDNIYDSSALIDNFQWLTGAIQGPITIN
ncbi:MAG: putative metal-binding motif-containing protein [Polyangia bacterium]